MMMEEEGDNNDRGRGKVSSLIEMATNSTASEVNPRLLKAIKTLVRSSDSEVELSVETLMEKMKKNHSQVRYLALLITDELFMRSKLFRSLLVVNFDQFLSLSIGFRRNLPLPAPAAVASRLRSKAMEFLEKWNTSFGIHYRQLRLGFDYLKNTLHFQFPNLLQNAARIQQERQERENRSKEILLNKFESLRENLSSIKDEIQLTVEEIGQCLDILHMKSDDFIPYYSEEEEIEEYRCSSLQQIRLESLKEGEKVQVSSDNKIVYDALKELYKLLVTRHLVSVQEWISVLVRVEPSDTRFRDSTLKEFIDLRNHLQTVKERCQKSGCALTIAANDEEEDLWEEGKIEAFVEGSASTSNKPDEDPPDPSTFVKEKNIDPAVSQDVSEKSDGGDNSDSNFARKKLLAEAPVMNWGSFLDRWGSKQDVLANQRGLELEGHWGRVDQDAVIPAEKIAELNVQAILYKEEHVETKPCLAPLKKGGLCQRRDLKVCPFHGPIIARDAKGNPIDHAVPKDEETPNLGTKTVQKLAEQAVKNVRGRDREEMKKRENDRKLMKRAKLAKVRGHNFTDLRQAAIASTSYSEFAGDAKGNSIDHVVPKDEETLNLGTETVQKLAEQAVKNVRGRDREEMKKRENDRKLMKRAKVREHNFTVLRQAAIASTSYSEFAGEDLERGGRSGSYVKEKTQTLASMLRKKVRPKDRLAQRLLSARARDTTTRQLTIGEDTKYREAFPNQW